MATPLDPDARRFALVAKQRFEEARAILNLAKLPAAAQYLGGYAIECALKALITVETPPSKRPAGKSVDEWMKDEFGHGLAKLRAAAGRYAQLPKAIVGEFVFVSRWDPQSRYDPGPGRPEVAERFLLAAERIIKWADGRM